MCSVWHSGYLYTCLLLCGLFVEFLGEFAKLRKATMSFVMSLRLFAWNSSVATDGFSWNLIYEYCSKLCRENFSVIKIWKGERVLYIKNNIHFWSYLAHFFLVWEMFQAKVVEEIKTHILLSITFSFPKIVPFIAQCGKILWIRAGHRWQNGAHPLHAG